MYIYSRMMIIRLTWIITIIFFVAGCTSITLTPPEKAPVLASKIEKQLLQQGGQYFKEGKFEPALQKAQEAFKLNPDNVEAMYAIATSYLALGKFDNSLEFSKRATAYKSEHLPGIYLLMGRTYNQLDAPWNALRTFRFAASQYPKNPEIQFRLGRAYALLNKPEFAAESFKAAIRLEPDNAASHFELGVLYYTNNYNTPALLSLSTALLLEPKRDPAPLIRKNIHKLLDREAKEINKNDEGDFLLVEKALSKQRTSLLQKSTEHTELDMLKAQYHAFFNTLDKVTLNNQKKTFVIETYMPLYNKIYKQGLVDAFVYYIFQGNMDKPISYWLKKHPGKIEQLERLVEKHKW